MIAKELLEELEGIRRNFEWQYDGRRRKIRATLNSNSGCRQFDPIGAVCYSRTGMVFSEEDWFRAAEQIQLSHIDAADLTAAANNVSSASPYVHSLRKGMIDDLRLSSANGRDQDSEAVPETMMGFLATLFGGNADTEMTSSRM